MASMSFLEKLKKRKEAQEKVVETTASEESIKASQEAAEAFTKEVKKKKEEMGYDRNSGDGYRY